MASVKKLLAQGPSTQPQSVERDPEARQCKRLIRGERQCKYWTVHEHGYCDKCAAMKSIIKLLNADKSRADKTRVNPKSEDIADPRPKKELSNFENILDYPQFYKWQDKWITHLRLDSSLIVCAKIADGKLAALSSEESSQLEEKEGVVCLTHIPKELVSMQV